MYWPDRSENLTKRLVFLGKELREAFHAMLAEHGATIPTWAVLNTAHGNPGLSQVNLAAQIGIEGPTVARHLDRLCAEGLVERRRDPSDRRVVRISLTDAGEARWAELREVGQAMESRLIPYLDVTLRAALDDAIDSIHRALEDAHVSHNVNIAG